MLLVLAAIVASPPNVTKLLLTAAPGRPGLRGAPAAGRPRGQEHGDDGPLRPHGLPEREAPHGPPPGELPEAKHHARALERGRRLQAGRRRAGDGGGDPPRALVPEHPDRHGGSDAAPASLQDHANLGLEAPEGLPRGARPRHRHGQGEARRQHVVRRVPAARQRALGHLQLRAEHEDPARHSSCMPPSRAPRISAAGVPPGARPRKATRLALPFRPWKGRTSSSDAPVSSKAPPPDVDEEIWAGEDDESHAGWYCVSTDPFPCPAPGCAFVATFMTAAHLVLVWQERDDPNLLRHAARAKEVGRNPRVVTYELDFGPSARRTTRGKPPDGRCTASAARRDRSATSASPRRTRSASRRS